MKTSLPLAVVLCALTLGARAESTYQQALGQLLDQRDKALAAAAAPIDAHFKEQAELLMQRATQNNDAKAVEDIKAALGGAAAAASDVVHDLKREINGTKWKSVPNASLHGGLTGTLTFTATTAEPGGYQYDASHSAVTLTYTHGGRDVLELTPDGKHLRYQRGPVVYELAKP
jgi:hypothetical protein